MNPNSNQHQHSVRRIVLPSGRSIEVVRFQDADRGAEVGLHVCPECDSELVQPVAWNEAEGGHWELTLHCPNCDWISDGSYTQEQLEQLEEKLDDGLGAMLDDLKRLTHANMADQMDRFIAALQADLIIPEDF